MSPEVENIVKWVEERILQAEEEIEHDGPFQEIQAEIDVLQDLLTFVTKKPKAISKPLRAKIRDVRENEF